MRTNTWFRLHLLIVAFVVCQLALAPAAFAAPANQMRQPDVDALPPAGTITRAAS